MFVALTDHTSHRPGDSFWGLAEAVSEKLPFGERLLLVSRGSSVNERFFRSPATEKAVVGRWFDTRGVREGSGWFQSAVVQADVSEVSGVLLRIDRPVSDDFLRQLGSVAGEGRVVNSPTGIIRCGAKSYLLRFSDLCPGVAIVRSVSEARARAQNGPIVLKPLTGYGGAGIVRVATDGTVDDGDRAWYGQEAVGQLAAALAEHNGSMLAMRFMPRVAEGDKRILIINGEPAGAVLRLPRQGGWICNLARGGTVTESSLDPGDTEIARCVGRHLVSEGVAIAGIDTLTADDGGRVLSEINCLTWGDSFRRTPSGVTRTR